MDWFRHDLNAHDDIKIKKLLKRCGFSALGIYWFLVELICCAGGRLSLREAIDEISLVDGFSENEAETLIRDLADMGLIFIEDTFIGSVRADKEIAFDADRRKKKSEAGKKGMENRWNRNTVITKDNTVITKDSIAITEYNKRITDYNTLPNHTLPKEKIEFVSKDTHSIKEKNPETEEKKQTAAFQGVKAHDVASEYQARFNSIDGVIRCQKMTAQREMMISAVLAHFSSDEIETVFRKVAESTYLRGSNNKGWKINFDWLFKTENFVKVLEGAYDSSDTGRQASGKRNVPTDISGQYAGFKADEVEF